MGLHSAWPAAAQGHAGRPRAAGAHLLVQRSVRVHRHEAQALRAAQRQKRVRPRHKQLAGARLVTPHAHRALLMNSGVSRLLRFLSLNT